MATVIYFTQLDPTWHDWVQIVNVGNQPTEVTCIARNAQGKVIWSVKNRLRPFQAWTPAVDQPKESASLEVRSDGQPIVGERHCHSGTQVLDFPGACEERRTIGRRLFFPELVAGATDWFRFLNVSDVDAHVSFVVRRVSDARVVAQRTHVIKPWHWWDVGDQHMGAAVQGTVEVVSTQPILGERHLHYKGGQTAVGQLGQVID
ncbi:MAG: hypothetical protein KatS3mg115_0206 [Candidatus Poribacteria bacterium]|nr:MAG: hypothetical protein KatS3mg115_0206 [Candidatus Poribacteria bacterium]